MMDGLEKIYDRAFFSEWGRTHERYTESARAVVEVLHGLYAPRRLIDLGAGCGVYGHFFSAKGTEVVSVDGVRPPAEFSYPGDLRVRDLTAPITDDWGAFDLTLCLEVAEHIPEPLADAFLANAVRFSERLVLSAAQPGQEGRHHVNTRPKRYWVAKLAAHGFAYDRRATGRVQTALQAARVPYRWMADPVSVYERAREPRRAGIGVKNAV